MRRFLLNRIVDENEVSGTGIVAHGVEFNDGNCVMRWMTDTRSTAMYDKMEDLLKIHGHQGQTVVEWIDDAVPVLWRRV